MIERTHVSKTKKSAFDRLYAAQNRSLTRMVQERARLAKAHEAELLKLDERIDAKRQLIKRLRQA